MSLPPLKYNQDHDEYYRALRRRVEKYFKDNGISRYANAAMYMKTALQLTVFFASYFLILSNWFSGWSLFALQLVFHFDMFLMSVGIAHDGSHNAYSPKRWVNKAVESVFDLIGINSHFWTYSHLNNHHDGPNVPFYDSAIESFSLVRLHPKTAYSRISRYQHWYMFAVYALVPLFLVFILEPLSFKQKVAGYGGSDSHSRGQILFMYISKAIVLGYTLILPLMIVDAPAWQILAGFFTGHMISGIALGVVFQTTHLSDYSIFPEPDATGYINHSYAMHIMKTTASFAVNNPVVTWIAGGLNLHTTHHLFPHICHIHLPALVPLLRETAKEFGVPYKEYTFWGAIASHLRKLKRLGNAPSYQPSVTALSGSMSSS